MKDTSIREYEKLAERLKKNIGELRRPLIIEFAGTPKSGKTLCLEAISKYLRRNNIETFVVSERSAICPISEKLSLNFNIWTGTQTLDMMLEYIERKPKVIILDRGLFDTLVWLKLLAKEEQINPDEYTRAKEFFLMERWIRKIDLVEVITVEPKIALEREYKDSLTKVTGSIMNEKILKSYNNCLLETKKDLDGILKIDLIDTSTKPTKEGVAEVADSVLKTVDDLADEPVALIQKDLLREYFFGKRVVYEPVVVDDLYEKLSKNIAWEKRTKAEVDSTSVQVVSVVVFYSECNIVTFSIRGLEQGTILENKTCVWIGGHVRKSDRVISGGETTVFKNALLREVKEEIGYRLSLNQLPKTPKAIIWDNSKERSIQHLALFFECKIQSQDNLDRFNNHEYWETPQKSIFTQISKLGSSLGNLKNWENWSLLYLQYVKDIKIDHHDNEQFLLT